MFVCVIIGVDGNRLLKILKAQMNQMKSNFERDINELKYDVLDLSADIEKERQKIKEIDKRLNESNLENRDTGSKTQNIPVEMYDLVRKFNELNERLDKESMKRQSLEEHIALLKDKCGLGDSSHNLPRADKIIIDELKERIDKLEKEAQIHLKEDTRNEIFKNNYQNKLNRLSETIKLAFKSEKTAVRNFTDNFTQELLSLNRKFEILQESVNKSVDEIGIDIHEKLDNVVQHNERARYDIAKYDIETLDLKLTFIEDKMASNAHVLKELQATKVDWKDIVNRNEQCRIANGIAKKDSIGPSIFSVSCNRGFQLNENAMFFKCESGNLFAMLDNEYRLIEGPLAEAATCTHHRMPSTVQNLVGKAISEDRIYIDWEIPFHMSWFTLSYAIYYTKEPTRPINTWDVKQINYGGTTTTTLGGLVPNNTYTIRVMTTTKNGGGTFSETINVKTIKGVLMQPTKCTAFSLTPNSLLISWSWPTKINELSILNYTLFYYDSLSQKYTSLVFNPMSTYNYILDDLSPSTTYRLQISAANTYGDGAKSNTIEARTLDFTPNEPKRVYATAINATSILVKWRSPSFPEPRSPGIIRGYIIFYTDIGENDTTVDAVGEKTACL